MKSGVDVSVIIPTLNRSKLVADLLDSLGKQEADGISWEVWVIDNGSTDDTPQVVESKRAGYIVPLYYAYEPEPGLHICRHQGAEKANGAVVAYLDDDMLLDERWLNGARLVLDSQADLVGGKVLPHWEAGPPAWIDWFRATLPGGTMLGYLSLIDLGTMAKPIDALYVFGGNCFVRKETVFKLKGYHPDSLPKELIRYRGDGETAFAIKFSNSGLKSYYDPVALAYHRINAGRLTMAYFCQRAYNQGISDSFTRIRMKHGLYEKPGMLKTCQNSVLNGLRFIKRFPLIVLSHLPVKSGKAILARERVRRSHREGFDFHQREVKNNTELLEWVLRESYLGDKGKLPRPAAC